MADILLRDCPCNVPREQRRGRQAPARDRGGNGSEMILRRSCVNSRTAVLVETPYCHLCGACLD